MTELEALRRVAEAARKWQHSVRDIEPRTDEECEAYEAFDNAIHALDALPTPTAPATPARSRLAALEALHAVVRDYDRGTGQNVRWADIMATLDELDALPTPSAEPVAEAVACYVSKNDGSATWVLAGSMADTLSARSENWRRAGEMRLPLPRVPEVVGEVG